MNTIFNQVVSVLVLLLPSAVLSDDADLVSARFTGEILTLLYVTDVRRSVAFYKALGFEHDYYYDYQEDTYTRDWKRPFAPQYAEMIQG